MAYDKYAKHKRPDEYRVGQEVICCIEQIAFTGKIATIDIKKEDKEDKDAGGTSYEIKLEGQMADYLKDNYPAIFGCHPFQFQWINETELVSLNNF